MGAGLAKQIKDQCPGTFIQYLNYIKDYKECNNNKAPLGTTLETQYGEKEIWNIFGQEFYGNDKCYTNYEAVKTAFINAIHNYRCKNHIQEVQIPIAIPFCFGCGRGGGDWRIMTHYLEQIEKNEDVLFIAYKYS